jgi:hypothetical protein
MRKVQGVKTVRRWSHHLLVQNQWWRQGSSCPEVWRERSQPQLWWCAEASAIVFFAGQQSEAVQQAVPVVENRTWEGWEGRPTRAQQWVSAV